MKGHTVKHPKIAIICCVNFVANNRDNKIVILLMLAAILFPPYERDYDVTLVKL